MSSEWSSIVSTLAEDDSSNGALKTPHKQSDGPLRYAYIRLAFEHLRVRAGMSDLHFHDLRHEAISRLFEKGLNIVEVSAISGHRELKMLQRYTHLRAVDLVARLG
ncbi:tyrosine-type recombinase/integrase [Bradyrhizobium sp. Ai1a-2]|uniref:tyrosine-type recombinase/integrase n=1 Tax=Bradyrhizobium sp. Ai1a-2 TaxID=196490 RepID=UPI00040C4002|nr:tyrosine-type recombinase/integrase [Bradyrhizobium sp. Ai1a-2]